MVAENKAWESAVRDFMAQQEKRLERLGKDVERLHAAIATNLEWFKVRAEKLETRYDDPVVVYADRSAGPAPVYHSADAPCGRGLRIEHPKRVLLGDAIDGGIRGCAFCAPSGASAGRVG